MKTQTQFKNASLVSVVNGSIVVKDSTEREHTFTNASVVSVNNGTIIIESKWVPTEGELIKYTWGEDIRYGIFKEINKYLTKFWTYGCSMDSLSELPTDLNRPKFRGYSPTLNISPVTPEEQKEFDDFCKSQGKIWNKETLQWEDYKWSPKPYEQYWYVSSWGDVMFRYCTATNVDQGLIQLGNAFPTKEQAQKAAEKVKELLKSL